jgi:hypothetical protein
VPSAALRRRLGAEVIGDGGKSAAVGWASHGSCNRALESHRADGMPEIPYPPSFVLAQEHLMRELEDECQALQEARAMDLVHLRTAVQAFAHEVKAEGGSVERALALLRACLKSSGLDLADAAHQQQLSDRTFAWAMEVYYGPS